MDNSETLNLFGEELMYEVRDYCMDQFHNSITKKAYSEQKINFQEKFNNLSAENRKFVTDLALQLTDTTIHYFLWMIERSEQFELYYSNNKNKVNLNLISDGLSGELYSDEGWIKKYSKYPSSES